MPSTHVPLTHAWPNRHSLISANKRVARRHRQCDVSLGDIVSVTCRSETMPENYVLHYEMLGPSATNRSTTDFLYYNATAIHRGNMHYRCRKECHQSRGYSHNGRRWPGRHRCHWHTGCSRIRWCLKTHTMQSGFRRLCRPRETVLQTTGTKVSNSQT